MERVVFWLNLRRVSSAHYFAHSGRITAVQVQLFYLKLVAWNLLSCPAVFWSHFGATAVLRNDESSAQTKSNFNPYTSTSSFRRFAWH